MSVISRLVSVLEDIVRRRRLRWVEVSIERAWSHDMTPRLFDLRGS